MGAAGPNPDPEEYDEEPDAELILISDVPEVKQRRSFDVSLFSS